ncbi:hypothetical protein Tco_0473110 [Tanacetum coccineum]
MLAIQAEEGEGSGHPSEPQPPPSIAQPTHKEPIPNVTSEPIPNVLDGDVYEEWDDRVERATTTAASLDVEQASGSPRCQEAMRVPLLRLGLRGYLHCPKVESLEADLKQTKQVYGIAYTKLIMKVKKLEKIVKTSHSRRRAKIVEDQLEDQLGVLSAAKVLTDAAKTNVHTYTRRRRAVSTSSGRISTAEESVSTIGASMPVSTAGMVQEVNISIPSPVVVKDKGKGKMEESKDEQTKRTKLQQEQERIGHEAAVRLQ